MWLEKQRLIDGGQGRDQQTMAKIDSVAVFQYKTDQNVWATHRDFSIIFGILSVEVGAFHCGMKDPLVPISLQPVSIPLCT